MLKAIMPDAKQENSASTKPKNVLPYVSSRTSKSVLILAHPLGAKTFMLCCGKTHVAYGLSWPFFCCSCSHCDNLQLISVRTFIHVCLIMGIVIAHCIVCDYTNTKRCFWLGYITNLARHKHTRKGCFRSPLGNKVASHQTWLVTGPLKVMLLFWNSEIEWQCTAQHRTSPQAQCLWMDEVL